MVFVPNISNTTGVRIAKAGAAAQRAGRADRCKRAFLLRLENSFSFVVSYLGSFLIPACSD
jgi:hypothetical protein